MRYRYLLFVTLLPLLLAGQKTVTGFVLDDATGKPVLFASIFLEAEQSYGVLTNEKGQYVIELDSLQIATGTLVFTSLSYKTVRQPLKEVDGYLNVRLETEFLALPEIIVLSDIGLRALMKRVVERIPENYGAEKYLLQAYHRSYFANDSAFAQLNEAYVTIEDGPYDLKYKRTKVWVDQFRNHESTAELPGGVKKFFDHQILLVGPYEWQSNPVREHTIWQFARKDFIDELTFRQIGQYLHGTDTLLRLRYEVDPDIYLGKNSWPSPDCCFAEILINKKDLAVLEWKWWTKSGGIYTDATYQKVDGKYYPQRASFNWALSSDSYDYPRLFSSFFYVTDVITGREEMKQVRKGRRLQIDGALSDLKVRYRPEYWQGEERLLQLPADETIRYQLSEVMEIEPSDLQKDTVSRDSSK